MEMLKEILNIINSSSKDKNKSDRIFESRKNTIYYEEIKKDFLDKFVKLMDLKEVLKVNREFNEDYSRLYNYKDIFTLVEVEFIIEENDGYESYIEFFELEFRNESEFLLRREIAKIEKEIISEKIKLNNTQIKKRRL